MLNTFQKVTLLILLISIQNIHGQTDDLKVLSIEEALKVSAGNFPDKTPGILEKEIKSAYYSWIYYINRLRILTEKKELYGNLVKIAELKYKAGEINIAEKALSESEYLKTEVHCVTARNELLISENNLKRALSIKNDILPENDSLARYNLPADIHSRPLDDTLNINDHRSYILHKEFENLKFQLKMYDEQLIFYRKVLTNTEKTIAAVKSRYDNEDIEYSDYLNIVNNALDFNLDYLKALNLYNQTALKIEAYFN